jgi:hypothetical protein
MDLPGDAAGSESNTSTYFINAHNSTKAKNAAVIQSDSEGPAR